jgi:hypothetical protein
MVGITSKEFINNMENKGGMSDKEAIGLTADEFININEKSPTVSSFTKKLKEMGMTEFSTGFATEKLLMFNQFMKTGGLMNLLGGGISPEEAEEITKTMKEKSREKLGYIE